MAHTEGRTEEGLMKGQFTEVRALVKESDR